jgi:hypothetical protein
MQTTNTEYTAEEYAAARALYLIEVEGAEQDCIDIVWDSEALTRECYMKRARAVIQAWLLCAGECSEIEEIAEENILPEHKACLDILAACKGHTAAHVCCALIVASVDRIADANGNKPQETLLAYLNYNNALIEAQHHTLNELYTAAGIPNPVKKMGEYDHLKEFLA